MHAPSQSCVVTVSNTTQNIMPEFRNACLQEYAKDALIGSFPFPPKILFAKYTNNKYFKHSAKICPKYF